MLWGLVRRIIVQKSKKYPTLMSICNVAEGVVTGLNDLYLKKIEEVKKNGYEERYL